MSKKCHSGKKLICAKNERQVNPANLAFIPCKFYSNLNFYTLQIWPFFKKVKFLGHHMGVFGRLWNLTLSLGFYHRFFYFINIVRYLIYRILTIYLLLNRFGGSLSCVHHGMFDYGLQEEDFSTFAWIFLETLKRRMKLKRLQLMTAEKAVWHLWMIIENDVRSYMCSTYVKITLIMYSFIILMISWWWQC